MDLIAGHWLVAQSRASQQTKDSTSSLRGELDADLQHARVGQLGAMPQPKGSTVIHPEVVTQVLE